jgi:hypothetical protein
MQQLLAQRDISQGHFDYKLSKKLNMWEKFLPNAEN